MIDHGPLNKPLDFKTKTKTKVQREERAVWFENL